jgi:hypothetical protein
MEASKKLLEVDFFFDPKPLTTKEKEMISDFIKADKERKSHIRKLGKTSIYKQPI